MKIITKNFYLKLLLFTFVIFTTSVFAQIPPPPPGGGHGEMGNQEGGGAPIGEGLYILTALAAAYATKKWQAIVNKCI